MAPRKWPQGGNKPPPPPHNWDTQKGACIHLRLTWGTAQRLVVRSLAGRGQGTGNKGLRRSNLAVEKPVLDRALVLGEHRRCV